jgi:hypothetical protein
MKISKARLNQIIKEEIEAVKEEYYDSRGDVEGYVDADELIGERLWVHTNRTHRNQNKNGMIGMYGVNNKGHRTGSPLYYTNCIRLAPPIVFQVAGGKSVDTIKQTDTVAPTGRTYPPRQDRHQEDG